MEGYSRARRSPDRALAAILLASLLLKLALLVPAHSIVPVRDSADYMNAAQTLDLEGRYTSIRPPLFPLALAACRKVARALGWQSWPLATRHEPTQLDVARLLMVLMSTVTVWLLYGLTRELFDRRAALAAAALCAFYPTFVGYSHLLWAETQLVMFHVGFVWLMVLAARKERIWMLMLAGALLGLAALTRQVVLSFAPFAVIWLWWAGRRPWPRTVRAAAFVALGVMVVVGPWTVRNAVVLERFVPVSAMGGVTLVFGVTDQWARTFKQANIIAPLSPEDDRRAGEVAWRMIRSDPAAYAERVLTVNSVKLWGAGSLIVEAAHERWGYRHFPRWLGRPLLVLGVVAYLAVVSLGILGMVFAPASRDTLFCVAIILHGVLVHAFFGSMSRHRFYLMPFFLLYSGYLVSRGREELRRLVTGRRLLSAVTLLIVFAVLVASAPWRRVGRDWRAFAEVRPAATMFLASQAAGRRIEAGLALQFIRSPLTGEGALPSWFHGGGQTAIGKAGPR